MGINIALYYSCSPVVNVFRVQRVYLIFIAGSDLDNAPAEISSVPLRHATWQQSVSRKYSKLVREGCTGLVVIR